ncbi:MAG: metallophosphoesterase [Caldisericia bacterium]|nr:metallophosphoesterase [Caldisericia bacterium]
MLKSLWLPIFIMLIAGVVGMELLFFHTPKITHYDIQSSNIPTAFNEFTILHISDLHDASFGHQQEMILKQIDSVDPSIVVFTGDLIERRYDVNTQGLILMEHLADRYPVYFVTGNHEEALPHDVYIQLMEDLEDAKITILDNAGVLLTKNKNHILLMGVRDALATDAANYASILKQIRQEHGRELFSLLLAHRPEFFNQYKNADVDVIFAGHTHGGQIRFPCIGGIYAPNQGFFPTYIDGEYQEGSTKMFVNRGLGATVIPFRFFNSPDISVYHLHHSDIKD